MASEGRRSNSPTRNTPALLISTSTRPQASRAVPTTPFAPSSVATEWVSAIASPPSARISAAMVSALAAYVPRPSGPTPRSLTTTRAPRRASSWA